MFQLLSVIAFSNHVDRNVQNQRVRESSAFFTYTYLQSLELLRARNDIGACDSGIPLEYFEWERVIVDEIHECLLSVKDETQLDGWNEKNQRSRQELLGIAQKDVMKR